jgi:transposase-like protein
MGVDACRSGPEVLVVNAKPRLSPWSRLQLVERVLAGRPAAHVAAEMGVSRATAYKWLARYRAEGSAGLLDRSSRPRSCPSRTDPATEAAILALRRDRRLGPARIAGILGLNASTVHRVLAHPAHLESVLARELHRLGSAHRCADRSVGDLFIEKFDAAPADGTSITST